MESVINRHERGRGYHREFHRVIDSRTIKRSEGNVHVLKVYRETMQEARLLRGGCKETRERIVGRGRDNNNR